ncbi:Hsp70 family protein [Enemella sp. A6]|uniref:Hsp70 family protein n=1 Tax=Enemella sp. A6 TaxID=3440152 RepID=UPI003EC0D649
MQLGVDFGTTRTVVAYADRGNYPVVGFIDTNGDTQEYFPSTAANVDGRLVFGFEALDAAAEGAPILRSFKRELADARVTDRSTVRIGSDDFVLLDVLTGFLTALGTALGRASTIGERPERCAVAVPAHAHGAQRFLTLEGFRRAGFTVTAMINEPSAAAFEYTHRQSRTITSRRNRVLIYDLGGGTFDASLVRIEGTDHTVENSVGVNRLGGDDFDHQLAVVAAALANRRYDSLSHTERAALIDDARDAKERLSPQTKRMALEVCDEVVLVPVPTFYEKAEHLVLRTVEAMTPLVGDLGDRADLAEVAGLYLVGGGSCLPLVPRVLRERFGRRVHRSPFPAASTAIGLAIATDSEAGYRLTDRLSRGFGVFREQQGGHLVSFDPILRNSEIVSPAEDTVITRQYRAAHNVGVFRFVEYASLADGEPRGDLVPFAEVRFGFTPELQDGRRLDRVAVTRLEHEGPMIEEKYVIDRHGIITVELHDTFTGYRRTFSLSS